MNNKIYISGPITGHKDWRKRFTDAVTHTSDSYFFDRHGTADLSVRYNAFRFEPVSALDYGREDRSWRWNMVKSLWELLRCSTVYFMRGWHESRGCRIEFKVAEIFGKRIIFEEDAR